MTTTATAWDQDELAQLAEAAWRASVEERCVTGHGQGRCPTRRAPYGQFDREAEAVAAVCWSGGCIDLLHDLLLRSMSKIDARRQRESWAVRSFGAYAMTVAQRELAEIRRGARVAKGFAAKPTRSDGVPGRVLEQLSRLPQPDHGWLVSLFRILRSYPFSPRHVPGRWPIDGLVEERNRHFTATSTPEQVRRDIERVLTIATEQGGPGWTYLNLVLPLNSNGATVELEDRHRLDTNSPEDVLRTY